jgi:putative transposase
VACRPVHSLLLVVAHFKPLPGAECGLLAPRTGRAWRSRFRAADCQDLEHNLMAFTEVDLTTHPLWENLSQDARLYLLDAVTAPARDVATGHFTCVSGAFPSRKMGASVPFESRRGELSYAVHLEFDDDVLYYFNQAPLIDVQRTRTNGTRYATGYYPDFLVVGKNSIALIQVKSEKELQKLHQTRPEDWKYENDEYVDLPASVALRAYGFPHRVISTDALNRNRTANYRLLLKSRAAGVECSVRLRSAIQTVLSEQAAMSMTELAKSVDTRDMSPILHLIDGGILATDLDRKLLGVPDTCWVSTEKSLLQALLDEHHAPAAEGGDGDSVYRVPSKRTAKRALKILKRIDSGAIDGNTSRWNRRVRQGKASGLSRYQSLLPHWPKCGNRDPKRPVEILAYAENIIRDRWGTATRPPIHRSFAEYKTDAKAWHPGFSPISKPTFNEMVKRLERELARNRGGARAANAAEAPTSVEDRVIGPLRPFELGTCDHCLIDLSCVVARKGGRKYTRRPWLTVLRDIYTGEVLSFWLSFARPSRIACACVLRSCLRRHGRLPEGIVVDHGAEFKSVYFRSLLAHLEIERVLRPASHPRYGSEAERFFGLLKTQWVSNRPGNWASIKEVRGVSGSHRPEEVAELTVFDFLNELNDFLGWHGRWGANSDERAPQEVMREGLERFPFSGRQADYNNEFELLTAVDVGKFAFDSRRGIKVGATWFWGAALAQPDLPRGKLLVRREPEDPSLIYVLVREKWIRCFSSRASTLASSDPVHRLASAVLESTPRLCFLQAIEDSEAELVVLQRQADARLRANTANQQEKSIQFTPKGDATASPSNTPESIWDRLRSTEVAPAPTTTWSDR